MTFPNFQTRIEWYHPRHEASELTFFSYWG